jgi:Contractile injection system tape measure protein
MEPKGTHIIQKSHLKINVSDQRTAWDIQARVADVFQSKGMEALEQELDRLVPHDQLITLDRLQLDLGPIDLQDLEVALPRLLATQLQAVLGRVLESSGETPAAGMQKIDTIAANLDLLLTFLDRGSSGWQAPATFKAPALLEHLLDTQAAALTQALLPMLARRHVRERLSLQFPEALLHRLLKLIAPLRATVAAPLMARLDALARMVKTIPASQTRRHGLIVHFLLAPAQFPSDIALPEETAWGQLRAYLLDDHWLDRQLLAFDIAALDTLTLTQVLAQLEEPASPLLGKITAIYAAATGTTADDFAASVAVADAAAPLLRAQVLQSFEKPLSATLSIHQSLSRIFMAEAAQLPQTMLRDIAALLELRVPAAILRRFAGEDRAAQRKASASLTKEGNATQKDQLQKQKDQLQAQKDLSQKQKDLFQAQKDQLQAREDQLQAREDQLQAQKDRQLDAEKEAAKKRALQDRTRKADADAQNAPDEEDAAQEDAKKADAKSRKSQKKLQAQSLERGKGENTSLRRSNKLPLTARQKRVPSSPNGHLRYKGPFVGIAADSDLATRDAASDETSSNPEAGGALKGSAARKRRTLQPSSMQKREKAQQIAEERKQMKAQRAAQFPNTADASSENQDEHPHVERPKSRGMGDTDAPRTQRPRPKPQPIYPPEFNWGTDELQYVDNAGLVLLNPFFQPCFEDLGYVVNGAFVDDESQENAVLLMSFMANGELEISESSLSLAKVLAGMEIGRPVRAIVDLPQRARDEAVALLQAAAGYWEKAGKLSPDQFREAFLMREGRLENIQSGWNLKVDRQTLDILLEFLPWGFGTIKLPWMRQLLTVDW